jgi:ESCRT-I complex subunit VPS28
VQFKACLQTLDRKFDVDKFMSDVKLNCFSAYYRLYEIGMPATKEHELSSKVNISNYDAKTIARVIHCFVTIIDAIKLKLHTIENLHPLLSELLRNINYLSEPSAEISDVKKIVKEWLISLNKRSSTSCLCSEDVENLARDMEQAHKQFYAMISQK